MPSAQGESEIPKDRLSVVNSVSE